MVDSTLLGDVVDECAAGAAELVIEADAGGEAEEALQDPFAQAGEGAAAVAFEGDRSLQVEKIDSIRWRIGARCRPWPGSSLRLGRTIVASSRATFWAKSRPA